MVASGGMTVVPKLRDISYLVIKLPKTVDRGKINLQQTG
jgi:hypothetical protein